MRVRTDADICIFSNIYKLIFDISLVFFSDNSRLKTVASRTYTVIGKRPGGNRIIPQQQSLRSGRKE